MRHEHTTEDGRATTFQFPRTCLRGRPAQRARCAPGAALLCAPGSSFTCRSHPRGRGRGRMDRRDMLRRCPHLMNTMAFSTAHTRPSVTSANRPHSGSFSADDCLTLTYRCSHRLFYYEIPCIVPPQSETCANMCARKRRGTSLVKFTRRATRYREIVPKGLRSNILAMSSA